MTTPQPQKLIIRQLQQQDYQPTWQAMQAFTQNRNADTPDEIWLLEHPPVFTQGQAGKAEHILNPQSIPVVQTDRGGQVTYHGPGQLMVYTLFDLKRLKIGIRKMVNTLEQTIIDLLNSLSISAHRKNNAPGIYVDHQKICSIGLRVRKGCSYHGIALNVAMDLAPFKAINPCGYKNLQMTQIKDHHNNATLQEIKEQIVPCILKNFGYTSTVLT